jgi:hypothetical protein
MSERSNAATRAHRILEKAMRTGGEITVFDAWTQLFGRAWEGEHKQWSYLVHMVDFLRDELESAREAALRTHIPNDIVDSHIDQCLVVLNMDHRNSQWQGFRQRLNPSLLDMLRVIAVSIPDTDGPMISNEDIQGLYAQLHELYTEVNNSDLPWEAKNYLREQINILLQALREYQVRGSVVFADAVSQARTLYSLKRTVEEENNEDPAFQRIKSRIGQIWVTVRERTTDAQVAMLLYETIKGIAGLLTG